MMTFSQTIIPVDNVRAATGGKCGLSRTIVAFPRQRLYLFEKVAISQQPSESESADRKRCCFSFLFFFLKQKTDIHMEY